MNSKQIKLSLALVGLAVAGLVFYYVRAPRSTLPDTVRFVCVATGKFYDLRRDQVPSILPAKNPRTGQLTLIPVLRAEDGKVSAHPRYAYDLLREPELAKVNRYVDPTTLEILPSPR